MFFERDMNFLIEYCCKGCNPNKAERTVVNIRNLYNLNTPTPIVLFGFFICWFFHLLVSSFVGFDVCIL